MTKILIVEDDNFLRGLLLKKIRAEAFEVDEADTGETGLKKIQDSIPDLVLLDLLLPGMDGFEVLKRLRQDQEAGHVPVIILSNLGKKEDIEKGYQLGADSYLVKSNFSPPEIIQKIHQALEKKPDSDN